MNLLINGVIAEFFDVQMLKKGAILPSKNIRNPL